MPETAENNDEISGSDLEDEFEKMRIKPVSSQDILDNLTNMVRLNRN